MSTVCPPHLQHHKGLPLRFKPEKVGEEAVVESEGSLFASEDSGF